MKRYLIFSAVIILAAGLLVHTAAQDQKNEIKRMSLEAEIILTGKVLNQKSVWNKNKTKISTNVMVEVEEYLKGNRTDKNIIVEHPGGEIGEIGEWYSHTPRFNNDEEVLLFLKKDNKNNFYKVLNGEDGKLSLQTDKESGKKITTARVDVSVFKKTIKNVLK